jgi:hypothetical protein
MQTAEVLDQHPGAGMVSMPWLAPVPVPGRRRARAGGGADATVEDIGVVPLLVPAYLANHSSSNSAGYLGAIMSAAGLLVVLVQSSSGSGQRDIVGGFKLADGA